MSVFCGHDLACQRGNHVIFTHVSFSVHSGEALVVIGCNGSGKTSLLRIMAGFTPPWHGLLTWNEEVINDHLEAQRARVHYIGRSSADITNR